MKKNNKIILIMMIGMILSCSKSFLELTPQQEVADTEALTNIEDYSSSITGIYNTISSPNYYGRYMFLIPDVMADDVKQNSQANRIIFYAEHVVNVSDSDASNLWTDMYEAINAANIIINSKVSVPSAILDEQSHIIGEAHALRGLVYFDMVRFFAQHYKYTADGSHLGVPLSLDFDPSDRPSRNTVKEVYDQIILDMTTAISLMKNNSRSGDSSTLSNISVKALLARVYLYKEDWNNAETMSSDVIGSSEYNLIPNDSYLDLWSKDNNSESIFEISMTDTDNVGSNGIGGLYLKNSYGDYLPSSDVISMYDSLDKRLSVFTVDNFLSGDYAPYRMEKYPDNNGSNNVKVIRLAELHLIRAEARAEMGINISGAQKDLDIVRQRALSSAPNNSDSGQTLKDAILTERRIELCFEGQRLWDLMRKKQDIVRNQCTSLTCKILYASESVVLPIPQIETDINENIEQNPGY